MSHRASHSKQHTCFAGRHWRPEWRLTEKMALDILNGVPKRLDEEIGTINADYRDGKISQRCEVLRAAVDEHISRAKATVGKKRPRSALASSALKSLPELLQESREIAAALARLRKGATCKDGRACFDPEARCDADCWEQARHDPEGRKLLCIFVGGAEEGRYFRLPPGVDVLVALFRVLRSRGKNGIAVMAGLKRRAKEERRAAGCNEERSDW